MPKLNFIPARDGFHFANNFTNHLPLGITTGGLCGGMALSAFNYFAYKMPVPTHATGNQDFGNTDGDVPPEGQSLRQYILDRQIDTFLYAAPFLVFPWDNNPAWHFSTSLSAFNVIKQMIDRGNFNLLGLRGIGQIVGTGGGHQVLVYGYDENPKRLYIYDSNFPDVEITLQLDEINRCLLHASRANIYASYFSMMELNPNNLGISFKPTYLDLGIKNGLTISSNAVLGGKVIFSATIKNYGDYNAHVNSFLIWLRDPTGRNIDYMTGGMKANPISIAKGQEIVITGQSQTFGTINGNYRAGVCYLSKQGQWINIPAVEQNTRTMVDFYVQTQRIADANVHPFPVPLYSSQTFTISAADRTSHQLLAGEVFYNGAKIGNTNAPITLTITPKKKIVWSGSGRNRERELIEYVPMVEVRVLNYNTVYVDISDLP